jgi:hypothetical protein
MEIASIQSKRGASAGFLERRRRSEEYRFQLTATETRLRTIRLLSVPVPHYKLSKSAKSLYRNHLFHDTGVEGASTMIGTRAEDATYTVTQSLESILAFENTGRFQELTLNWL